MTPILRQICGCELCIITKDIHIDLNRFRTNIVSDLQQESFGTHEHKISYINTSDSHYNSKVFLDGECLHASIKYIAQ